MTVYYVDPVNGSNSNNGLSWGSAWLWPPGDGSTVSPGDEIRFAKAQKTDTSSGKYAQNGRVLEGLYSRLATASTWSLGSVGGSISGRKITIPPSTNISANTKIMYCPLSYFISTSELGELLVAAKRIPTAGPGTYLKVCLCSDASGNTIVGTMNGPTWFNDSSLSKTSFTLGSPGATVSFSSIAIYSVNAFTTSSGGDTEIEAEQSFSKTPTPTSVYIRAGSMVGSVTPPQVAIGLSWSRPDFYQFMVGSETTPVSGVQVYPEPRVSYPGSSYNSNYTYIDSYQGLPFASDGRYDTLISYSGNSGARIKFSGGWDIATGLQDGYTYLGMYDVCTPLRKGAFVFSSGGSWIDFERFVCPQTHFVYYDYTVSSITGLRLYDCTIGCSPVSGYAVPSFFGAAGVSGTVAVDNWYMERCTGYDFFSFSTGQAWSAQATPWRPYTDFSFGGVELVDCVIQDLGATGQYVNCPSGDIIIRSSVAGELRSLIVSAGTTYWQLAPGSTGTVEIQGTAIAAQHHYSKGDEAVTQIKGVFTDIAITNTRDANKTAGDYDTTTSKAVDLTTHLGNFLELTLDGYAIHNSFYRSSESSGTVRKQASIILEDTDTFRSLNPSYVYRIGGPVSSFQSYSVTAFSLVQWLPDVFVIKNPPAVLDFSNPAPVRPFSLSARPYTNMVPGMLFDVWSSSISVIEPYGSFIHFNEISYTPDTYWPNLPTATVTGGTGKVSSDNPLGLVRALGTKMFSEGPFLMGYRSVNPVGRGVMAYGVELDAIKYGELGVAAKNDIMQRGIVIGAKGSLVGHGSSAGYDRYVHDSITVDDDFTMSQPDADTPSLVPRGCLFIRSTSGRFWMRLGRYGYAESSGTVNQYGKRDIYLYANTSIPLARLDVLGGENLAITLVVRPQTTVAGMYCAIVIPPCTAYTTDISGHSIKRVLATHTEDETVSFNISTQKPGEVHFNFRTSVDLYIKNFSVETV